MFKKVLFLLAVLGLARTSAAQYPTPTEGDWVVKDFRFRSGEILPELRLHYRTLGKPERDAQGVVRNAVLILHGTGGSGAGFIRPEFAGELFCTGGLLDADATSSFSRMESGMGNRASRVMGCVHVSRVMGTSTWLRHSIAC